MLTATKLHIAAQTILSETTLWCSAGTLFSMISQLTSGKVDQHTRIHYRKYSTKHSLTTHYNATTKPNTTLVFRAKTKLNMVYHNINHAQYISPNEKEIKQIEHNVKHRCDEAQDYSKASGRASSHNLYVLVIPSGHQWQLARVPINGAELNPFLTYVGSRASFCDDCSGPAFGVQS